MNCLPVALFCGILCLIGTARADIPGSGCFDFEKDWKPLQETAKPAAPSGELNGGGAWAFTERTIHRSLKELIDELKSHERTKSGRIAEMEVTERPATPKYLSYQTVRFEIHPFLFINIEWKEDWVYSLKEGKAEDPSKVVVGFQKIEGTSHIKHLCGSYILTRKGPDDTEVSLYEETRATSRSREDMENGSKATLEQLARPKTMVKKSPSPE